MVTEIQTLIARDGADDTCAPRVEVRTTANWLCVFTPSPALIARGVNVDVVRARLREHGEIVTAEPIITPQGAVAFQFEVNGDVLRRAGRAVAGRRPGVARRSPRRKPPRHSRRPPRTSARGAILSSGHYVRVDLARLDELMRMIGNLVILRARLTDTVARSERHLPAAHHRAIEEDADAIERELRELREAVMRVRLVPIGEIFRRMPFVVRDLARDSGRSVNVVLSGQDTKIDKFLVERMMDPVLHLVRNAVSHGIETPAEREAAGKPPAATLRLSAQRVRRDRAD